MPKFKAEKISLIVYLTFWLSYFSYFWFNVFEVNKQGDLTIGQANMWADWALHHTLTSTMAIRELIPSTSPLLIDTAFSYPFFSNLISAVLIKLGLDIQSALVIPSFIFSIVLIVLLYLFFFQLFKNTIVALLASSLFLFNGGIGFYYLFEQGINFESLLNHFVKPAIELTNIADKQIKWMSVINSLFLPQRSLLMGFSLSLLVLWRLLKSKNTLFNQEILILPMFIIGLMPIIHLHSFLAMVIILTFWMLAELMYLPKKQRWTVFKVWVMRALIVCSIAIPLLLTFFLSNISEHEFKWHPGWMAKDYQENWLIFWFKNWTLVPLIATLGYLSLIKSNVLISNRTSTLLIFLPFFIFFILVNSISIQPWIWDNTKLLVWASLGFSGLSAYLIVSCFQNSLIQTKLLRWIQKSVLITLLILIMLSGFMDVYRNIRLDSHRYTLYNKDELLLSEWVKNHTAVESIWLTSPKHNHWLLNLTGRQAFFSYSGWLWSHGINYQGKEAEMKKMYLTAKPSLFQQNKIDYVVIDNYAIEKLNAKNESFVNQYQLIKQVGEYQIFRVNSY